jgi:hypothetical protein
MRPRSFLRQALTFNPTRLDDVVDAFFRQSPLMGSSAKMQQIDRLPGAVFRVFENAGKRVAFSSAGVYSGGGNNASSNVLLNGYAFSSSLEPITFSGLENGEYNLVLFGTNAAYSNGASTDFTVSNTLLDPSDPTQSATKTTTEDSTSSSFSDPANYIEFTDVVVTNHTISASYKVATAEADFNGAQLEYVGPAPTPEPSSFALVAISIGGLVFLARRHLKA